jgi:hypothetical protein
MVVEVRRISMETSALVGGEVLVINGVGLSVAVGMGVKVDVCEGTRVCVGVHVAGIDISADVGLSVVSTVGRTVGFTGGLVGDGVDAQAGMNSEITSRQHVLGFMIRFLFGE